MALPRPSLPTREEATMLILRAVSRYWGIHPALLPQRHYTVFARAGIAPTQMRQTMRRIHSMDEWPHVWRQEGEKHLEAGNMLGAFLCLYIAQRVMIDPSDEKSELYAMAASTYRQLPHRRALEMMQIEHKGHKIGAYVQEPKPGQACLGTVLLVPG